MVSRLNRILQGVRDAILLVSSVLIMGSSYGKWVVEPAHYVLFGLAAILFSLTAINIILLLRKIERKGYFYFNTIVQLPISFILAGLLGLIGIVFLIINLGILLTLRGRE